MAQLVPDVLLIIFTELKDDPVSLHSCLLVNKDWFNIATPILWKYISYAYEDPFLHNPESRLKLYNVIAHFLPNDPEDPLPQNNIILPLNKLSRTPTLNYMNFFTRITPFWILDMAHFLIKVKVKDYKRKIQILEEEIYKLIFSKCLNVKYFSWDTEKNFYEYPNSRYFFSNLDSLEINWKFITNQNFSNISKICQNISKLEINYCGKDKDKKSLINFIKNQNNLQSLFLDFNNVKGTCKLLSNVIRDKGPTLKNITLQPTLKCVSPIFIQSLDNILEITLNNKLNKNVDWQEWEKYLNIKEFPHLIRLQTSYLPFNIVSIIIGKSGGKILEIDARHSIKFLDYTTENKNLIITISKNCPLLTRLGLDVDHKNLSELSMMFSNCKQLEEVNFTTVKVLPTGDELLRVINDSPLNNLRNISFSDKWNFSLEGVKIFLKNWKSKNRLPIKFTPHYDDERNFYWTVEHNRLVEWYQ